MTVSSLSFVLSKEDTFRYQLLSRLKGDCDYYLGFGNKNTKHLWAIDEEDHIKYMKEIWKSFDDDKKPEWLSYEEILLYEKKMCGK